jgi:hypothetical protein
MLVGTTVVRIGMTRAATLSVCILLAGCATTNGRKGMGPRPGTPEYAAQAQSGERKAPPPCSTWLNRGRAGGTVGSVVGFIAASALGSPALGLLYTVAGYGAGFASAAKCQKEPVATAHAPNASDTEASYASPPTATIAEEELE